MGHTQKWKVEQGIGGPIIECERGGRIADVTMCGNDTMKHANLIAAAPAMYEALKKIEGLDRCWCHAVDAPCYACMIRAAIAAAEGVNL